MKMILLFFLVFLNTIQAQQNAQDSFVYEHAIPIEDISFLKGAERIGFDEGVILAQQYKDGLALMTFGDPWYVDACTHCAYEYWGVRLISVGSIMMKGTEGKVAGFNSIMRPRIRAKLGAKYDSLGLLPSHIQNLKEVVLDSFRQFLSFRLLGEDSVFVQLTTSKFAFLYGEETIVNSYSQKETSYFLSELEQGIIFPKKRENLVILQLQIGAFEGDGNWCGHKQLNKPIRWNIPFRI